MRRTLLAAGLTLLAAFAAPAWAQSTAAPTYLATNFAIPAGPVSLSSRLYAPVGRDRYPVVVLIFGSGDLSALDSANTSVLAEAFTARGIGALVYDKRGTGASTGVLTGSDFEALGADAAAVLQYAQRLPQTERVGFWGLSQAGWFAPYLVRRCRGLAFAILVSPAGVNPHEQVASFLRRQAIGWGLTGEEADAADRMHRAVALYYAGRASYRSAQEEVDRHRDARWFHGVVTHMYWDEMSPEGRVLTPEQLATALRERPEGFEIYRSRSSFVDYARSYRALRRLPTLIVYGGGDELVPIEVSRAVWEGALRGERRHPHEFRVFEGASHDIQSPDGRVRPDYLDTIGQWAAEQFAGR
jgi:pimeloyl-ACP methyl ester carboxylesterase